MRGSAHPGWSCAAGSEVQCSELVSCQAVGAASTDPTGGFDARAGSGSPAELVLLAGPPWAPGQAQGSRPGSGLRARPSTTFELALVAQAWGDLEPLQAFVLKNPFS